MCEAKYNEKERKWNREDNKECYNCQNSYSTSAELFECEYENGEKYLYCAVCLGESPLSNEPEQVKSITRVR
jgi:hypothetical protein